jgi:L-rhamnonate dehydratase
VDNEEDDGSMRITAVTAYDLWEESHSWLSETLIANPMSIYPRYRDRRSSWNGPPQGGVLVLVETDEGITGIGMGGGGAPAALIIEKHFTTFLRGADPFNIEALWDQMFRASLPYGRKGTAIMAISGVDLALWDIVGKATNQPVYRLIGGQTKERIPVYGTGNHVEWYKAHGYRGFKLAMPHGPADGYAGMRANVELVRASREAIGLDAELMLDCYMAWTVEYSVRMAEMLEPYRVRWIEEFLPPDDIEGYAEVKRRVRGLATATGEHEYTRFGFRELIDRKAADILQPDINWVGGLSETIKICHMAAAVGLPVIPHGGGSPWGIHLIMANVNCPWAETFIEPGVRVEDEQPGLLLGGARPQDGYIVPSEAPGFGLTLNEDLFKTITSRR